MKILLVHLDAPPEDELRGGLEDAGHDVRVVTSAADAAQPWAGWRPDVIVARLEADTARTLDAVDVLVSQRSLAAAPLLVTGGNELAITAARRRFPEASFARLDSVSTALASIEANE